MRQEETDSLLLLGKLNKVQKCIIYKAMANMIVRDQDKPVRYAIRASLIMFISLLYLPHHPSSILIAAGIGLASSAIL